MDRASDYRKQADHSRQLAEATWQDNLEEILRRVARDFDCVFRSKVIRDSGGR
jgi:hypothetical protein